MLAKTKSNEKESESAVHVLLYLYSQMPSARQPRGRSSAEAGVEVGRGGRGGATPPYLCHVRRDVTKVQIVESNHTEIRCIFWAHFGSVPNLFLGVILRDGKREFGQIANRYMSLFCHNIALCLNTAKKY